MHALSPAPTASLAVPASSRSTSTRGRPRKYPEGYAEAKRLEKLLSPKVAEVGLAPPTAPAVPAQQEKAAASTVTAPGDREYLQDPLVRAMQAKMPKGPTKARQPLAYDTETLEAFTAARETLASKGWGLAIGRVQDEAGGLFYAQVRAAHSAGPGERTSFQSEEALRDALLALAS